MIALDAVRQLTYSQNMIGAIWLVLLSENDCDV